MSFRYALLLLAAIWLAAPRAVRAEDVTATATLSQESTTVGEPVELQIKITGAQQASPIQVGVDGLEIAYQGSSTEVQFNNFVRTSSVTQTYSVKPLRTGKFVIPGEVIDTGGTKVATNSVKLTVARSDAGATAENSTRLAFGELVVSKQSAYVGEMIPVEFRVYLDERAHWSSQDPPEFSAAGFTMEKIPQPTQTPDVRRNGRPYSLVVFKTAISPVKAGKLTFGPVTFTCLASIPQRRPQIPHFANDPFPDDIFGSMTSYSAPQEMTIKSDGVEIEAKALPPGQPKSFSGAVGAFTLSTDSSPSTVRVGDPVTLSAAIAGWGNLEGVRAPVLTEDSGWRVYPPSSTIKAGDDVRIHGSKTFEFQMVPLETRKALPALEFSYFDPISEKYVTLNGGTLPVTVTGGSAIAAATPALAQVQTKASAPSEPPPAPGILYIRTDSVPWGKSFQPLYATRAFWEAQLAPFAALAGIAGLLRRREKARTAKAKQLAALRREKQALWRTLEGGETGYAAFVDAAARCIQVDTAFATGGNPTLVDADAACASRPVKESTAAAIKTIFKDREAICYAGVATGSAKVPSQRRAEILAALNEFDHAHV